MSAIKFEELFDITPESTQKAISEVEKVKAAYKAALKEIKAEAVNMHKALSGKAIGGDADNKAIADLNAQISKLSQKYVDLKVQRDKAMGAAKKFAIQNRELKKTVQDNTTAFDKLNKRLRENKKQAKANTSVWKKMTSGMSGAVAIGTIMASVVRGAFRLLWTSIKDGVRIMADFESQMAGVRAITKATDKEFIKLEADAIRLGGATIFTAKQVGELQIAYGKLGFSTVEILNATEATLQLAAATDESLGSAAKVAGSVLRAFQLDAIEMQRVVDVMAESFTSSALDVDKFRESMKFLAPVAKKAGFTLEDTTAILGKLADAGLSGSLAGTSLRSIFLKLADSSSDLTKQIGFGVNSMDTFMLALKKLRDSGISLGEALELTDKRAVTAFSTIISGIDGVNELRESLVKAADAARGMADIRMDTLIGKTTILKSAWEGLVISIGNSTNATTSFGRAIMWATKQVNKLRQAILTEGQIASEAAQKASQDTINAVKSQVADSRVLKFDEAQAGIKIAEDEYKAKIITYEQYYKRVAALSDGFNAFQSTALKNAFVELKASLQKRVDAVDDATKREIGSYKFNLQIQEDLAAKGSRFDKAKLKHLDKTIGKQAEVLQTYLNEEQALADVTDILGQMASTAVIAGAGLEKLSDDAFKEWAKTEKIRIEGMRDGMLKEIEVRKLTYKILKHNLELANEDTANAHANLQDDIADIEAKWAKKRADANVMAMASGLQKQIAVVYQSYREIIRVIEDAGVATEAIITERNRKIRQIYIDHYTKLLGIEMTSNKARIDESEKLADLQEQMAGINAAITMQDAINARDFTEFTEKQNKAFLENIEDEKTKVIKKAESDRLQITLIALAARTKVIQDQIDIEVSKITVGMDEIKEAEIRSHIERLEAQEIFNGRQSALIKAQIKELKAIQAGIGQDMDGGVFSIWSIFGIDADDPEGAKFISAFKSLMSETMDAIEEAVDFEVDMADRAVDASQSRLDRLISHLDIENQKKQEGYASNVSALETAIATERTILKKAEAEQIAALRRKRSMEAIAQTINMVTATSEIIKAAAAYGGPAAPFIAAGLIAGMWGLFLASQAKASGSIGLKEGVIDLQGPGTGTSDSIPTRLSKGESVMTAGETKTWKPVFTAIRNNDSASAMMEMSRITGQNDRMGGQLQQIYLDHDLDNIMGKYYGNQTSYEDGYRVEKRGNLTRRIKVS